MLAVELLVAAVVVVLAAAVARLAWATGHREEAASISEAQARENAAPLTMAILALGRREQKRP